MYGIEKIIFEQLLLLKESYQLEGIKAEFEAEGSSFNDLVRLRRITEKAGVPLFLKIGGVEALRDIKDSLELGVDGLIAPMVESRFGLKKFIEAYNSVYKNHKIKLSINIETKNAIEQIDDILLSAHGFIDNITLGRTDLSASFMDESVFPDSSFILDLVGYIGRKAHAEGLSYTVGGSISSQTIEKFQMMPNIIKDVKSIETRKVVLPRDVMLNSEGALNEALRFEELYILSKKEISDIMIESEIARLDKLSARVKSALSCVA